MSTESITAESDSHSARPKYPTPHFKSCKDRPSVHRILKNSFLCFIPVTLPLVWYKGVLPPSWKPAWTMTEPRRSDRAPGRRCLWIFRLFVLDTSAAIRVGQGEAGFVCTEYHAPLLSIPTLMVVAESHVGTAMTWCHGQMNDCFP